MEKKLRIQLFDNEGRLVTDRLVSQDPEFNTGPKIQHDQPIRIEFTLMSKDDIDRAQEYLNKLTGILPLSEVKKKRLSKAPLDPRDREDLLNGAIEDNNDQNGLIDTLRTNGFIFMTTELLETYDYPINLKDKHKPEYQWMIKRLKVAKNPINDKYDPMLLFGFRMFGEPDAKIVVYLDGAYHKAYKLKPHSKSKEVIRKAEMMKFPPYMTPEERERFRYEFRLLQDNPEKEFTKNFKRWREWVENVPELPQDKKDTE